MPNKKGSKVAASRAKAQVKAKKKARSPGPAGVASGYRPPTTVDEDDLTEADALDEGAHSNEAAAIDAQEASVPAAVRPAAAVAQRTTGRAAPRRERVAMAAVQGGATLRREVGLISAITVVAGAALALLKILTDIGR